MWKPLLCGLAALLALTPSVPAQLPVNFRWVDFKQEPETFSKVTKALGSNKYSAIREIGIMGDSALVFTTWRESRQDTPQGDSWDVYQVSMSNATVRPIMSGYKLEVKGWLRFQAAGMEDLGIVYLSCWECEATSIFTVLHYEPKSGWRARWRDEKYPNYPGMSFYEGDAGEPYTDERIDQVFAVFAPDKGLASAGTWYRSRNMATGKVTTGAYKYFVDPRTGEDRTSALFGAEALSWARRICAWDGPLPGFGDGQDTASCKLLLGPHRKPSP